MGEGERHNTIEFVGVSVDEIMEMDGAALGWLAVKMAERLGEMDEPGPELIELTALAHCSSSPRPDRARSLLMSACSKAGIFPYTLFPGAEPALGEWVVDLAVFMELLDASRADGDEGNAADLDGATVLVIGGPKDRYSRYFMDRGASFVFWADPAQDNHMSRVMSRTWDVAFFLTSYMSHCAHISSVSAKKVVYVERSWSPKRCEELLMA